MIERIYFGFDIYVRNKFYNQLLNSCNEWCCLKITIRFPVSLKKLSCKKKFLIALKDK